MLAKRIISQGLLLKNAGAMSRAAYHDNGVRVSMNDLPVPQGDWKEHYTRQNTKYNAVLATGIVVLAGTLAFVKSSGVIFFNFFPPKSLD